MIIINGEPFGEINRKDYEFLNKIITQLIEQGVKVEATKFTINFNN